MSNTPTHTAKKPVGALFLGWSLWILASMLLPPIPYVLFMALVAPLTLLWSVAARKRLKGVLAVAFSLAMGFALVHGAILFFQGEWGAQSRQGAFAALGLWLRIVSILTASQYCLEKIPPPLLVRTLLASSLPVSVAFVLAAPTLLLEQIKVRFAQIREAQVSRGVPVTGTLKERATSLTALLFPLILGLLNDLPDRSAALDTKSFKLLPYRNSLYRNKEQQRMQPQPESALGDDPLESISVTEGCFFPKEGENALLRVSRMRLFPGEWGLICGGNGSGKSTLGRILSGGVPEHRTGKLEGEWLLSGKELSQKDTLLWSPHTQYVQQTPSLCFSGCTFTAAEEVAFGLENRAFSQDVIRERVAEALCLVGVSHLAERNVLQLSGGEAQKILLAASIAMRPHLLILDEALSRISYDDIAPILEKIKNWSVRYSVSLLFLERHGGQVAPFCDQHASLQEGELLWGIQAPSSARFLYRAERTPSKKPVTPILQLQSLSFGWDKQLSTLISDANASLYDGERVALLGGNGAGKSTLLRLCAGLLPPVSGSIRVCGQAVGQLQPQKRSERIGFLFQEPERQIFRPTVREEVLFSLRNHALSTEQKEERLQKVLDTTGLKGKERKHPLDLNSAERRMVGVASLTVCEPRLLLLDEPTREFDDRWMELFSQWLRGVDAAVLVISHDPDFVSACFDRSWTLKEGQLRISN